MSELRITSTSAWDGSEASPTKETSVFFTSDLDTPHSRASLSENGNEDGIMDKSIMVDQPTNITSVSGLT
jgi:hypothetical protein